MLVLKGHEDLGVKSWGGIWLSTKNLKPGRDARQWPDRTMHLYSAALYVCKAAVQMRKKIIISHNTVQFRNSPPLKWMFGILELFISDYPNSHIYFLLDVQV